MAPRLSRLMQLSILPILTITSLLIFRTFDVVHGSSCVAASQRFNPDLEINDNVIRTSTALESPFMAISEEHCEASCKQHPNCSAVNLGPTLYADGPLITCELLEKNSKSVITAARKRWRFKASKCEDPRKCNPEEAQCFSIRKGQKGCVCKKWPSTKAPKFFSCTDWKGSTTGWHIPGPGYILLLGDFNGDGMRDMLFHRLTDGIRLIVLADHNGKFGVQYWHHSNWCYGATAQLFVGDINRDGRSDILCHNYRDRGDKEIYLATAEGKFEGPSLNLNMGWCAAYQTSMVMLGDFNGDGQKDLFCSEGGTKYVSIAQTTLTFPHPGYIKSSPWCGSTGSTFYIADVNGDSREDWICHNDKGETLLSFAPQDGRFTGSSDWEDADLWCPGKDSVVLGDFNGDGKADLLCRDLQGYIGIRPGKLDGFGDVISSCQLPGLCSQSDRQQMFAGDFNNDKVDDLLCYDQNGGAWISYNKHKG